MAEGGHKRIGKKGSFRGCERTGCKRSSCSLEGRNWSSLGSEALKSAWLSDNVKHHPLSTAKAPQNIQLHLRNVAEECNLSCVLEPCRGKSIKFTGQEVNALEELHEKSLYSCYPSVVYGIIQGLSLLGYWFKSYPGKS